MSAANHIFLPWVQSGASASIPDAFTERLADDQPSSVTVQVGIAINSRTVGKSIRLYGPGDVTGIDPQQVVRLEPRPGTSAFEPNYFPFVEFDRPDFPWLFSPAKADAQGRLRPWLALVVVRRQPGVELRPANGTPLPVLEIKAPARPGDELPDLAESHFWAHAQTTGAARADLQTVLQSDAARTISRLLCPRRLDPGTGYLACVVPAYEVGRAAGLGETATESTLSPAWRSGEHAPPSVLLPVYYSWEFRTAADGDFEALVRRLEPRELPAGVGKRPVDISHPGFALDPQPDAGAPGTVLGLEGALRVVGAEPDEWLDGPRQTFQAALAAIVNTPWRMATTTAGGDPIVAPPVYGAWHAGVHEVAPGGSPAAAPWLHELNLDPRHRAAAAMGTEVVRAEQEPLMASAWEQLGAAEAINQRLRQAQLSRAVNERYHEKLFTRLTPDALVRVIAPARSRVTVPDAETGQPMLFAQTLARSSVPPAAVAPGVRKVSRPRGPFNRQYSRAGARGTTALFTFFNKPAPSSTFGATPGIRGMVGTDDVSAAIQALIHPSNGFIWVLEPSPHWERIPAGFLEMLQTCRFMRLTPGGMGAGDPAAVPAWFPAAARAHQQYLDQLLAAPVLSERRGVLDAQLSAQALASLRPAATVSRAVLSAMQLDSPPSPTGDELEPVKDAPTFPQPMYAALRDRSPEYLFPGVGQVPPDTVQLLETNNRFIEAFMVGLNSEMGRELLWRGYPTDQRGTPFRQFWDATAAGPGDHTDIPPVHRWGTRALGSNARNAGRDHLVLLIRGELMRRYPGIVIYAVKAVMRDSRRMLATDSPSGVEPPLESHPMFRGTLDAHAVFVGFDLTRAQVLHDSGWFFVLQEQPAAPRFGLDEAPFGPGDTGAVPPLDTWNDLSWGHIAGTADALSRLSHLPVIDTELTPSQAVNGVWGRNAAHMAIITKQRPVRVAIHASELLP